MRQTRRRRRLVVTVVIVVMLACPAVVLGEGDTQHGPGGKKMDEEPFNMTAVLHKMLDEGYDKRVRPQYGKFPVTVGVTMYVTTISRLSEVDSEFTMDMYFRQFWQDKERSSFLGCKNPITLGREVIDRFWRPDTFIANEKQAFFHTVTVKNNFLRVWPDGRIILSTRFTVSAMCPMDLRYFPMDRQNCTIEVESFGYTVADIIYKWNNGDDSVGIDKNIKMPQFRIIGHKQRTRVISLSTGNYSRLSVEFHFVREMGYYLIQIYIPSSLIVVISWVSFWLSRDATPARVALGVTTVLTMTTLMSSTNASLPKISYVKSIDVYLGICFLMVFSSLLEYAAVGYLTKSLKRRMAAYRKKMEKKSLDHNGGQSSPHVPSLGTSPLPPVPLPPGRPTSSNNSSVNSHSTSWQCYNNSTSNNSNNNNNNNNHRQRQLESSCK